MSQIAYRANLSAKSFPFVSASWGRTVIVPQYDNTFNRQVSSQEDADKDVGIPQAYYMHNCMPTAQGFQSIAYNDILNVALIGVNDFVQILYVKDGHNRRGYVGITAAGDFYVCTSDQWFLRGSFSYSGSVTVAYVSGLSYIYLEGYGCIRYDFGTGTFIAVVLTGLVVADTIGITAAAGYLIAWTESEVAWSSTIDPTDFTPSLATGAGGGSVEGARGAITFCVTHTQGFIVYTSANAVAAVYSGNSRYPFNFREIVSSGGLNDISLVSYDSNSGNHYAYTTSGFQLVSTSQTQSIFPDLTDFIAGKLFEDYDEDTEVFTLTKLTTTMVKMVNVISDRYLVVSYGMESLTHAVVYDIAQKRFGKLKITHVDTFEYQLPSANITEIPRQSIGFLQADGTLKVVDFSMYATGSYGVIFLGKYQFIRARNIILDTFSVENIPEEAACDVKVLAALDGKTTTASPATLAESFGTQKNYACRAEGKNISLAFVGSFQLDSLELKFHIGGKR